jgi:hypothetical protein
MGFGQYDGTLDKAEKRIGEFAGWRAPVSRYTQPQWVEGSMQASPNTQRG